MENPQQEENVEVQNTSDFESQFYIGKVSIGKERKFLFLLNEILKKREDHGIYGALVSDDVKGYIFLEVRNMTSLIDSMRGLPNFKGAIKNQIKFEDIEKYFTKEIIVNNVNKGDIVKVIAGPFKGDNAKVIRVVSGKKNEIIIESLNTQISIPITIDSNEVRVIEQNIGDEEENE